MRLDVYLVENGFAKSRSYASELIKSSLVKVDGSVVTKPSYDVDGGIVELTGELYPFVGRGGVKLDHALETFSIDVCGMCALDVGASTGGFTDCLLKRGARSVVALDSGHGQLAKKLADDDRVVNMEGFNAKDIGADTFDRSFDIAVCDVSFISQTLIAGGICEVLKTQGVFISLIKPQFECGRQALGKGGIVKDKKYHYGSVSRVISFCAGVGLVCENLTVSPVKGGDGNTEFLALFRKGAGIPISDDLVKEVTL